MMFGRWIRGLPALIAIAGLSAQELHPWPALLKRHRSEQLRGAVWRLVALGDPIPGEALFQHEAFLRLKLSGEWVLESIKPKASAEIRESLGLSESNRWLLLSPSGRVSRQWESLPTPEVLLKTLEGEPWRSRAHLREEFLKLHPDSLMARAEDLQDAVRYLNALKDKGSRKGAWTEVEEGLEKLFLTQDWPRHSALPDILTQIPRMETPDSVLRQIRKALSALQLHLRQEPSSEGLWTLWEHLVAFLPFDVDEAYPRQFLLPPGEPWPSERGLEAARWVSYHRGDFKAFREYCREQFLRPWPSGLTERSFRTERLKRYRTWGLPVLRADLRLKDEADGRVWLEDLRRLLGRDWQKQGLDEWLGKECPTGLPASWNEALHLEALEDPSVPESLDVPSRPGLFLDGPWFSAWQHLRASEELDLWGFGELDWHRPSRRKIQELRRRYQLGDEPRWFVLDGEMLKASGTQAPEPSQVAVQLARIQQPRLAILGAFLDRNPDHLEARKMRLDLLRNRMPHSRLEGMLLEDAAYLCGAFRPDERWWPGASSPIWHRVWEERAPKVLRELEQHIQARPEHLASWRAWIQWSEVDPNAPEARDLARNLSVWGPFQDPHLNFPEAPAFLVAEQLMQRRNWKGLHEWASQRWEAWMSLATPIHPELPLADDELRLRLKPWLNLLVEACQKLGLKAEAQAYQARYRTLSKPGA